MMQLSIMPQRRWRKVGIATCCSMPSNSICMRHRQNRSIGIILCAEKDRVEVELALEDMGKPIGVADYQLIVPKEKLQKVLADEIKAFSEEKEI